MILAGELKGRRQAQRRRSGRRAPRRVARGPVREAFRAHWRPPASSAWEKNRGVFVRQISVDEADEIYDLRAVMDELRRPAGWPKIGHAGADESRSRAIVERMEPAARAGDARRSITLLNLAVPRSAGRSSPAIAKLAAMYRKLVKELALYRRRNLRRRGRSLPHSAAEHRAILEGDRVGQRRARPARAMYDHVMESQRARASAPATTRNDEPRARTSRRTQGHESRSIEVNGRRYATPEAADRRRLRRRLRARLHRSGSGRRPHAYDRSACWPSGTAPDRLTAWCRASRTRTTCRSSPVRRPSVHGICGNYLVRREASGPR